MWWKLKDRDLIHWQADHSKSIGALVSPVSVFVLLMIPVTDVVWWHYSIAICCFAVFFWAELDYTRSAKVEKNIYLAVYTICCFLLFLTWHLNDQLGNILFLADMGFSLKKSVVIYILIIGGFFTSRLFLIKSYPFELEESKNG